MSEREVIKAVIDFAFMMKAQLQSDETALLRSILSMAIMESEDLIEILDDKELMHAKARQISSSR